MNDLNFYETDAVTGLEYIKESLKSGVSVPLTVTGSSMMPLLKPHRDIVWLERCGDEDIKKGAILLFERSNGKPVLHRVIKIKNNELIMNGDAQKQTEKIEKKQVVACVKKIERNGKTVDVRNKKLKVWDDLWRVTRPVRPILIKIKNYKANRGEKR